MRICYTQKEVQRGKILFHVSTILQYGCFQCIVDVITELMDATK